MKLTKYFSMHYVTIAALVIVAVVKYIDHGFPVNLVVAVLTTSFLDSAVKTFWLKRKPTLPQSAIITGLIIGTVAMSAPVFGVFVASVLAMFSKFVIRLKGAHIFNPAVFGVVITQVFNPALHSGAGNATVHGASQIVEGFGPGGLAVPLILVPFLLFANYRARKLWIARPYLIATILLFYFTGLASFNSFNLQ
ncbi:MAG: hypothetical protein HYT11_02505, partial [Candidatus Levybacteria bacterium]|nr:hypothetical protein [Candidatus Levybacteria bacterium]